MNNNVIVQQANDFVLFYKCVLMKKLQLKLLLFKIKYLFSQLKIY